VELYVLTNTNGGKIVETVSIENEEELRVRMTSEHPISLVEDSAVKSKGEQYALEKAGCEKDRRLRWWVNGRHTLIHRTCVVDINWVVFRSASSLLCERQEGLTAPQI
jgi:hypothetical protein